MSVRMFNVGEYCVHKGYICRVDAVERVITGQNGYPLRAYMSIKIPGVSHDGQSKERRVDDVQSRRDRR